MYIYVSFQGKKMIPAGYLVVMLCVGALNFAKAGGKRYPCYMVYVHVDAMRTMTICLAGMC